MTRKTQPEIEPEFDEYEAEEIAVPSPPKRQPDREPAFLRFEYQADEHGMPEHVTTINYTPDRELWKRAIKGATDTRGVFKVVLKNKSQSILGHDSVTVESDFDAAQPGASQPTQVAAAPPVQNP